MNNKIILALSLYSFSIINATFDLATTQKQDGDLMTKVTDWFKSIGQQAQTTLSNLGLTDEAKTTLTDNAKTIRDNLDQAKTRINEKISQAKDDPKTAENLAKAKDLINEAMARTDNVASKVKSALSSEQGQAAIASLRQAVDQGNLSFEKIKAQVEDLQARGGQAVTPAVTAIKNAIEKVKELARQALQRAQQPEPARTE